MAASLTEDSVDAAMANRPSLARGRGGERGEGRERNRQRQREKEIDNDHGAFDSRRHNTCIYMYRS